MASDALRNGETFEGTWEEIAAHARELSGKRVRLTVISDTFQIGGESESIDDADQVALHRAFEGLVGTVRGLPADLGANSAKYFAEIMDEKWPKGRKAP